MDGRALRRARRRRDAQPPSRRGSAQGAVHVARARRGDGNTARGQAHARSQGRAQPRQAGALIPSRRMIRIDDISRVATASGDVRLCDLEHVLAQLGLTLGLLGACTDTVGARLAAPSPLDRSPRYGRLVDACIGIEVDGAGGRVLRAQTAPRKAAGPDWRALIFGAGREAAARVR
ncbi:MAG: FAD-binding protein, partial [Myxococcota bacterium]